MPLVTLWHCWPPRLRHRRRDRAAMSSATSFSRWLCVVAVTMAFMVGIVVGILLPVYVPSTFPPPPLRIGSDGGATYPTPNALWRLDVSKDRTRVREDDGQPLWGALSWPAIVTAPPLPSTEPSNDVSPESVSNGRRNANGGLSRPKDRKDYPLGGDTSRTNSTEAIQSPSGGGRSLLLRLTLGKELTSGRTQDGVTGRPRSAEVVAAAWPQITRPFPYEPSPSLDDGTNSQPWSLWNKSASDVGDSDVTRSLVDDGVYWSDWVESLLPSGFSGQEVREWIEYAGNATVVKVLEGCGRMQNRLVVFGDGTKSCCRYRQNNDQIQGEIFSFYLAQLLGLSSLPPATLGLLHGHDGQWQAVRGLLTLAQWNEQKPVVMTKFVDGLTPAYIPRHFRGDDPQELRRLHPTPADLAGLRPAELRELAQWSDLVIFDYLTANLDRVINNMYNRQWNPDMMAAPAHNLARVSATGLLVFLDNESGLLHGYRLLDKYEPYHRAMLDGLCLFRRSTANAVRRLHRSADVGPQLKRSLHESQPNMAEWLPLLPDKSVKILRERLARVVKQMDHCERVFGIDSGRSKYDETLSKPSSVE